MKFIKLLFIVLLGITFNANSQCNTNTSICAAGQSAPFGFIPPSSNPSSCLDFTNGNGANYGYVILYITASGPLNLLIDSPTSTTGFIDVAIFDITGQADPCNSLSLTTEIGCNYATASSGCNQFGNTFPCASTIAAPIVTAGDVLMILVEDWSGTAGSFTLELDNGPGSAQTGPGDPTITPAGPFIDTDPATTLTAANGGGTWTASCGACIDPNTGVFDPSVAGNGTHNICYTLGAVPCDATDCIDVIVGPSCNMTGITANAALTCPSPTYTTTGTVDFTTPPTTGTLTVSDCNGNQQVFNAPFVSPINYTINNQSADGLGCDITATFSATPACSINIGYTAPICPCNIDVFTVNINTCEPSTNTYSVSGSIEFSMPPSTGTLTISVNDGLTTYDTIINAADFISPLAFSISGIDPNGNATTISATFSADGACTSSQNYTAPSNCNCTAAIGTFVTSDDNATNTDYVLCFGDQFNYQSNGDWTAPPDVNHPTIPYNPGIGYLIYSCPPTAGMTPDSDPITGDPCVEGLVITGTGGLLYTDINDLGWINTFPPGTFTDNIIYYVPVTIYDVTGNWYSVAIEPCFELGPTVAVQYLPEIKTIEVEDCQAGSVTSTVTGGLSELDGSNYTVVAGSLLPTNASFQNSTAIHGGTITITGLTNGQNFSYDIQDVNGCPVTVSGTFIGTENPGFNYSGYNFCTTDPDPTINITGAPGGFSYTVVSGGPTLALNVNTGAIDLSTSNEGVYDITYLTNDPTCFSDSTVTMTINFTPTINNILDQTVCSGSNFTDVIFVGTASPSEATTYAWTNDNTSIGLVANGTGTITGFTGSNLTTNQISGLISVTPSTSTCTGTPATFNYIVDPMDDPTFDYVNGLTYCLTGTNPVANISGNTGGVFSYNTISGGPTLSLNTATGDINLSLSQLGSYDITYVTSGVCSQSLTLTLDITNAPEANFSFGTYCLNGNDPMPDFVNDDTGTPFAVSGNGGIFSEPSGNLSINTNTGLVDLDASVPGTYTITNTINIPGCALENSNEDITILVLPTAIISGGGTICPQGDLSTLNIQVDFTSTGLWDLNYTFNGANQNTNSASPFILSGAQFGFGTYALTDVTDANGCSNTASGSVLIDSFPIPSIHPHNNYSACEGDDLLINPFVGFEPNDIFHWVLISGADIGFGTSGTGNIGNFTSTNSQIVTVQVTPESANGCFGPPIDFDITINPVPIAQFSADKLNGCEPTTIIFTNESLVGNTFDWTFGNGVTASGPTVSFTYENAGVYDIGLTVTTNQGCSDALMQNAYITITPTPIAAFSFTPYVTDVSHTEIEFTNSSIDGDYYEWDFGDETELNNETDPIHNYEDIPMQYTITLLVTNNNGLCKDSTVGFLVVNDIILYYVPNVFTPDFDEFNQTFKPIFTSGFDPFDYHLQIYNRWGELIFESYNADIGWDGTYPKDGKLCQDGVYIWKINFKETMSDKKHLVEGHVTLLR